MEPRRLIEAALFMSSRELSIPELKKLTGIASAGHVKAIADELIEDYKKGGSAIEIVEINGAYSMRVREEFLPSVKQFAQESEISHSALRTLSYIARHNGILKSEVVKRMGTGIYDDVKELVQSGFLLQRKFGRSSKLFLTDKFRSYFEQGKGQVGGAHLTGDKSGVAAEGSAGAASGESAVAEESEKEKAVPAESFSDMQEGSDDEDNMSS